MPRQYNSPLLLQAATPVTAATETMSFSNNGNNINRQNQQASTTETVASVLRGHVGQGIGSSSSSMHAENTWGI